MVIPSGTSVAASQVFAYQSQPDQHSVSVAANTAVDKVSISDAGKLMSENTQSHSSAEHRRIFALARSDEKLANELIDGYTNGLDHPLVDISQLDLKTGKGLVYTETGKSVTSQSEAVFNQQTVKIKEQKNALIQSEREKGTSAADIFEKIIQLMDKMPQDYKDKIAWNRISA